MSGFGHLPPDLGYARGSVDVVNCPLERRSEHWPVGLGFYDVTSESPSSVLRALIHGTWPCRFFGAVQMIDNRAFETGGGLAVGGGGSVR